MRRLFVLAALLFALPAHAVEIEWVEVGNPGNACEVQPPNGSTPGGCFGAVDYVYRIAKYETTNGQYAEFLNAVAATDTYGLYIWDMGAGHLDGGITRSGGSGWYTYSAIAGREDMPVNFVSWYDTLRFANWLHNGQTVGAQDSSTTEDGAYTFSGATSVGSRNAGATIFLPTEDEWYKAAYYDGALGIYYDYPTGTDTQTVCTTPAGDTGNSANCGAVGSFTDVGAYGLSGSPYGTFDQGGNAHEWNEAIISGSHRGVRGGAFTGPPLTDAASYRLSDFSWVQHNALGFRIATTPELASCDDGADNDGDGLTDHPDDPGCADASDLSERDPTLPCDDGADNDGDGGIDFDPVTFANPGDENTLPSGTGDPGCGAPTWSTESPQCQDGFNNDFNTGIDFDGARSVWGVAVDQPDPQCVAPWWNSEAPWSIYCGLGAELALLLPALMWMWRRRRA